jgi:addiction module HigA family antidote
VVRPPAPRDAPHPGALLFEEFVAPAGLTHTELASRLGVSRTLVSHVLAGRRRLSADLALRLARLFGVPAEFWLTLQLEWDLAEAHRSPRAREIERIRPLERGAEPGAWCERGPRPPGVRSDESRDAGTPRDSTTPRG